MTLQQTRGTNTAQVGAIADVVLMPTPGRRFSTEQNQIAIVTHEMGESDLSRTMSQAAGERLVRMAVVSVPNHGRTLIQLLATADQVIKRLSKTGETPRRSIH